MNLTSHNFGIGTDCIEISRFEKDKLKEIVIEKIFSKNEIEYCYSRPRPMQHFAARFCGKEAIMKALSFFREKPLFSDIEIINDNNGMPFVKYKDEYNIKLSLSHSSEIAMGFSIVIKK